MEGEPPTTSSNEPSPKPHTPSIGSLQAGLAVAAILLAALGGSFWTGWLQDGCLDPWGRICLLKLARLAPGDVPRRTNGYTYQRADGNRLASGAGSLPDGRFVDIRVNEFPEWVVGVPAADGSNAAVLAVVLGDGRTRCFRVSASRSVSELPIEPLSMSPGKPGVLSSTDDGRWRFETFGAGGRFTHPSPVGADGLAAIRAGFDGESILFYRKHAGQGFIRTPLHDARILTDGADAGERFMMYTEPTIRYLHGVLGDRTEAGGISIFATTDPKEGTFQEVLFVNASPPSVFEGLFPIWAHVAGDGQREIIATAADSINGASVVVYDEEGRLVARSEPVSNGSRWRHVAMAGAFGPDREKEIVDVVNPDELGRVQFMRVDKGSLAVAAAIDGFTSHLIGTRNLDMIAGGDFDGDGKLEVLVPKLGEMDVLAGIRHEKSGANAVWEVPLGNGELASNIATVTMPNGRLVVAAGTTAGTIRVWV